MPVLAIAVIIAWLAGYLSVRSQAWWLALVSYLTLGFLVAAIYHRKISHNAFELRFKRPFLFILSFLTSSAGQGGPLWWAATHRDHHRNADGPGDPHSAKLGFWWCHMGWLLAGGTTATANISDYSKYWELRLLDQFHWIPALLRAIACYLWFGIDGLLVGFVVSTAVLYQATFLINSAAHLIGTRPKKNEKSIGRICWPMIPLGWGEWAHQPHHDRANRLPQGDRWYHMIFDFAMHIVCVCWALGLTKKLRFR